MTPRWLQAAHYLNRAPEIWRCARRVHRWWPITRAYLQLGASDYPMEFKTYSGVHLQLRDFYELVTAWVVFCRDEYIVPRDAAAILDLGANYGAFTLLAAKAAPKAQIVSVEPYPANFEALRRNVDAHGLHDRVRCWPCAVAVEAGVRGMSTDPDMFSHWRKLLAETETHSGPSVMVDTMPLAALLERMLAELRVDRIDLVKIDIEGDEHELLPDAPANLLDKVRAWQMEYHPRRPKAPLFAALERAGFRCVKDIIIGPDYGVAHFERKS